MVELSPDKAQQCVWLWSVNTCHCYLCVLAFFHKWQAVAQRKHCAIWWSFQHLQTSDAISNLWKSMVLELIRTFCAQRAQITNSEFGPRMLTVLQVPLIHSDLATCFLTSRLHIFTSHLFIFFWTPEVSERMAMSHMAWAVSLTLTWQKRLFNLYVGDVDSVKGCGIHECTSQLYFKIYFWFA